ncbi:MAG: radical SAM protein [Mobilitalea sp.]
MDKTEIVIWGASYLGLQLKKLIDLCNQNTDKNTYEVCFFCDNDETKLGSTFDNIPVLSFNELQNKSKDGSFGGIIVIAIQNKWKGSVTKQLRDGEIANEVYGYNEILYNNRKSSEDNFKLIDFLYKIDITKPRLDYIEYHVAHHCNLKCKGCGHLSNVAEAEFGNLDCYIDDIKRLKELFWGIEKIRLMGGEPLLNPSLSRFIIETRKVFPDTEICIVTNGLLLRNCSKEFFKVVKDTGAIFNISLYPPTKKIKGLLELKLMEEDIAFKFTGAISEFFRNIDITGNCDVDKAYSSCVSTKCHFLLDGKLALCPMPLIFKKLGKHLENPIPDFEEDYIDIHKTSMNGWDIVELFSKPIKHCAYCKSYDAQMFKWEPGGSRIPQLEDWLIQ